MKYFSQPAALKDELVQQNKTLFYMAMAESELVIQIEEMSARALPIKNLRCRVEEKHKLSHDVMLLKIKLAGDERLQYHAGQYVEFILEDGKGS